MRIWVLALSGLLASWAIACSSDGTTDGTGGTAGSGGSGGSESGVVVSIPDGAADPPVEATIREIDASGFPRQDDLVSPVFDIGPSGTQFDIPVTVGIPINPDTPAGTVVEVVRFDEASGDWESLEGTMIIAGSAFARTDHFSNFALLQSPDAAVCDNIWSGGPGSVPPLHTAGGLTVVPGTKTAEDIAFSGPSEISLGSTWETQSCSVTVSGNFGAGLMGDGGWIDYSNGRATGTFPQTGGGPYSFALQHVPPNDPRGPFLGLSDPCYAPLGAYPYNLNIHFAADCGNLCQGVTCSGTGPCGNTTCNPANGQCEGPCGSSNAGKCVQGLCMVEVSMSAGESGNSVCAAEGLTCDSVPVLNPPEGACIAFNPTATVSSDANGWEQGIYCNDNMGLACAGRTNDCHSCPPCNAGLNCTTSGSDLIERVYASCVP